MMKYESSRNRNEIVSPHMAIIKGLASDGGLYTPSEISIHINPEEVLNLSYQEMAARIIGAFLDDFSVEEIQDCVNGAYDQKFDSDEIVPLKKFSEGYLMELWHGPTSAFKDIALTLLPRLLTKAYEKENRSDTIAILTATSGDTGKAAISGFADVPHTAITVFYPEIGVSAVQKKQMQTSAGENVEVIAVKGNFDDCQRMVKEATSNELVLSSLENVTISSANSINIGRLVPQIVYYYSSYAKLVNNGTIKCGDEVNFVVPTGNFGDILAGYLAKTIGLPVHKFICASNANNVLTDFLNTGCYSTKRDFHATMSPSMDILISSNLERLLSLVSDHNDTFVKEMMTALKENGTYQVPSDILTKIQNHFVGYWTNEKDCADTISHLYHNENTLIDTHTSIAVHAMEQYVSDTKDERPCIVLSTASPYKFAKDVLNSIQPNEIEDDFVAMEELQKVSGVPIPKNLANLNTLPVRFNRSIEIDDGMKTIAARMKEIGHVTD